jgi:hypothetical protein
MAESPSRVERRVRSRKRSRTGVAIGSAIVVIVAAAVVGILVFSGGDGASSGHGSTADRPSADTNVSVEVGEVSADSAGPPVTVSTDVADRVIDLMGNYREIATVEPLRTAQPAGDLSGVFDAAALARANGVDRPTLVDDGLPQVTGDLDVVVEPVAITGLGDQDGNLVAVTASVNVDVTGGTAAEAPLGIKRFGYFVLVPDPAGVWKVSSYSIVVTRDGGGLDATTSTAETT